MSAKPLQDLPITKIVEAELSRKHTMEGLYSFKDFLGVSGYSKVQLAVRLRDGEQVVVKSAFNAKCLPRETLQREFDILKRMRHPYIVQALEFIVEGPDLALVTEYVPGCSLHQFMMFSSEDCLRESFAQPLAKKLFQGIEHMHANRICHQAIDPKNVWMTEDHRSLKLTDFCKARCFDASFSTGATEDSHDSTNGLLETLAQASDVWGGGICLYLMLSGHAPQTCSKDPLFPETSTWEHVHVLDDVQCPLSPASLEVVTQSLAPDHSKRPAAAELLQLRWMQAYQNVL